MWSNDSLWIMHVGGSSSCNFLMGRRVVAPSPLGPTHGKIANTPVSGRHKQGSPLDVLHARQIWRCKNLSGHRPAAVRDIATCRKFGHL